MRRYDAGMSWRRFITGALVLGLAATVAVAQSPSPVDTAGWTTYRNDTLGFEVRHPATWIVGLGTGTAESVLLNEPRQLGRPSLLIQFFLQRGINPTRLSIDDWYADQMKKVNATTTPPTTHTLIGGRATIRREIEGSFGNHFDFYTPVNTTDIFTIAIIRPSAAPLDPTQVAVLSTLRFKGK
jgi:hypothetical protein